MKSKLAVSVLLSVMLIVVSGTAFAGIDVVSYDDTEAWGVWDPSVGDAAASLITNGDFSDWDGGFPMAWTVWADDKAGWENAHLAYMDYNGPNDAMPNPAMGLFVRNIGGAGPFYGGAYQMLDKIAAPGYYWVTVHATLWGEYRYFDMWNIRFHDSPYNSVAWYGIGGMDPASVEWREVSVGRFLGSVLPCHNEDEVCGHWGRNETVYIEPGQYFHLQAGHKFGHFNYWTVFGFDDISIVPAAGPEVLSGFTPDAAVIWDQHEIR